MTKIIDGKKIASEIQNEMQEKISQCKGRCPGLAFILVGDHPPSQTYVRMKKKACSKIGMHSLVKELPETVSEKDLIKTIQSLNEDRQIDGILVQLPLPKHIQTNEIIQRVDPSKDVDGFHPINVGKLFLGEEDTFFPCTPHGIKILLEKSKIPIEGKHVVILGRSNIVGKPLAAMLMQKKTGCNATVTIAHSKTKDLITMTKSADILIAAIGKPHFVTKEMVNEKSVIVDVGINRIQKGNICKIVGDVEFDTVAPYVQAITPVPGGVGSMTIALLLKNTLTSFFKRENL